MIASEPSWIYTPQRPRDVWGADARLCGDYVVGVLAARSWFCLDRTAGAVIWERRSLGRPNQIIAVSGEVIVAAEYRSGDGPWSAYFGVYGIGLTSGKLLWTSHGPGGWGRLVRAFDFVPDFTNELRDTAHAVIGGEIVTESGRRLDPATGRDVGRCEAPKGLPDDVDHFCSRLLLEKEVAIGDLGTLVAGRPGEPQQPGHVTSEPLCCHLVSPDGKVRWTFDAEAEPLVLDPKQWGFSLLRFENYLLFAVAAGPSDPAGAAPRKLLSLNMRSGVLTDAGEISSEPLRHFQLIGSDARGLLVGGRDRGDRFRLMHFSWERPGG